MCIFMYMCELVGTCARRRGEHAGRPLVCITRVPSMFEDMFALMICDFLILICGCGVRA